MKRILALLTISLLAISASAQTVPLYSSVLLTSSITNAPSSATNAALVLDVRKQAKVGVQVTQKNDASGTAAITYVYSRSADGVTYCSTYDSFAVNANGTTAVTTNFVIDTYGLGFIKFHYITNAAASAGLTNLSMTYAIKLGAP